ncbi:MAG: TIGR04255 family protein [candidate division Zixibacteria bacterium]|nr:TIGR04255 family protein [candidate division Zixibacteria bacterium]
MGVKLKNSPIVEVICEFKFKDSSEDLTIYGDFHNEIGKEYIKKKPRSYQEVIINKSESGIEHNIKEYRLQQFFSDDEKTLIQIGSNILAINRLKPYQTWEEFLPVIKKAYSSYIKIAKLKDIKTISLKYINKINFKKEQIDFDDYFLFKPEFNEKLGTIDGRFILGSEFRRNKDNDLLRITLANTSPFKGFKVAFLLDLEYSTIKLDNINISNTLKWVKNAHTEIETAFFNCLTDNLIGKLKK